MKISYRAAAVGAGAYTVLGDESDRSAVITDYAPQRQQLVQTTPLFRATKQVVFSRGNSLWTLNFTVERIHATLDAAVEYIATHPAALPQKVDLKIEQGAKTVYLPAASLAGLVPTPRGLTTIWRYSFAGPDYTTTAP